MAIFNSYVSLPKGNEMGGILVEDKLMGRVLHWVDFWRV